MKIKAEIQKIHTKLTEINIIEKNENLPEIFIECFTHSSVKGQKNNEKLEFLGDSILNFSITQILLKTFPQDNESKLSKRRSFLVSREICQEIAENLNLQDALIISKGERNSTTKNKNLACLMEALIGAIFTQYELKIASDFVEFHWESYLKQDFEDIKTIVQEICHKKYKTSPVYEIIKIEGEDHNPLFTVKATIPNTKIEAIAIGNSKKLAEKNVAVIIKSKIK